MGDDSTLIICMKFQRGVHKASLHTMEHAISLHGTYQLYYVPPWFA